MEHQKSRETRTCSNSQSLTEVLIVGFTVVHGLGSEARDAMDYPS